MRKSGRVDFTDFSLYEIHVKHCKTEIPYISLDQYISKMSIKLGLSLICMFVSVYADCDNSITVEDVPSNYDNDVVNGVYERINEPECNSRDVFNHTTNAIYLRHVADGGVGTWVFSNIRDCADNTEAEQYVRATDEAERNPGLVQSGWKQRTDTGDWVLPTNPDISVDCYEISRCRYQIKGATDTSLNVYYDKVEGRECEFRDVHKHESQDLYLYFIRSTYNNEYYWVVNSEICIDAVHDGAVLQNDDYSVAPEFVQHDWEELNNDGNYVPNTNIDIDCFEGDPGLSAGAIAGIVIGCVAFVAIVGGLVYWCVKRD